MYTLAVFSDSHGQSETLYKAMKKADEDYHAKGFLFLGDGLGDFLDNQKNFPHIFHWEVQGNNDFFYKSMPQESMFMLEKQWIYAAHGHQYGVKSGADRLLKAALGRKCNIACYGHTHIPQIKEEEGVLLFNPGAIGAVLKPSFGIIEIEVEKTQPYISWM